MLRSVSRFMMSLAVCWVAACQVTAPAEDHDEERKPPVRFIEIGRVSGQGSGPTQRELVHWGIPSAIKGSRDASYRIMVNPHYRYRALAVLRDLERSRVGAGYGITYE